MSDKTTTETQHVVAGPVEAQVLRVLRTHTDDQFGVTIAQRSPVGPRAVQISGMGLTDGPAAPLQRLADWLGSQSWVGAVAIRPQHVYVRVATSALRSWVAAGLTGDLIATGSEGRGRSRVVRFIDTDPTAAPSLELFRQSAVARAVASLLRSRGFQVALDPVAPGTPGPVSPDTLVVGAAPAPDREGIVRLPVGEVDVRHGALRARHGGSVSAGDVLGELRDAAPLSLLLLGVARRRRVQLDDDKLEREARAFEELLALRSLPAPDRAATADGGDQAIRELAATLDTLPGVAARAASALDAVLVIRFIRTVVERGHRASTHLHADDPLWPVVGRAIDVALDLAGIPVARGATSPAGVEPEA